MKILASVISIRPSNLLKNSKEKHDFSAYSLRNIRILLQEVYKFARLLSFVNFWINKIFKWVSLFCLLQEFLLCSFSPRKQGQTQWQRTKKKWSYFMSFTLCVYLLVTDLMWHICNIWFQLIWNRLATQKIFSCKTLEQKLRQIYPPGT